MAAASEYVFGYGSLAAVDRGAPLAVAVLAGYERVWDVAMDNAERVPGYKWYVDPVTGERPAVCVTFLDIVERDGEADAGPGREPGCVGFLLPVSSPGALTALDRRERNYDRIEVTALIDSEDAQLGSEPLDPAQMRVWTYVGKASARERYGAAAARGDAVIQAAYLEGVERAFAARGLAARYAASTRPPACPVRELTRVNDSSRS